MPLHWQARGKSVCDVIYSDCRLNDLILSLSYLFSQFSRLTDLTRVTSRQADLYNTEYDNFSFECHGRPDFQERDTQIMGKTSIIILSRQNDEVLNTKSYT